MNTEDGIRQPGLSRRNAITFGILAAVALILLYPMSREDFLLFHSIVELFTVLVAFGIFVIAWNTRDIAANNYLTVLGTGFLFVGLTTILHMLAYKGMGVFPGRGGDLPTQLWLISRGFEAASLLVAGLALYRPIHAGRVFVGFGMVWLVALASLFPWHVFPTAYIDGVGLTPFKIGAEYVIVVMLGFAFAMLWRGRARFEPHVGRMLVSAVALMVVTEITFTRYVSVVDVANFFGHYLALMSFALVYLALIDTSLVRPFSLLFREVEEQRRAEHAIAEVLQNALVSTPDKQESVEFGHVYQSATTGAKIGGDFYDLFSPAHGLVSFVIGDVSGKGVAAAAATAMVRSTLRAMAYDDPDPEVVLSKTNAAVRRQLASDKFVTAIYGVIDTDSGVMTIAGAGHPNPVLRVKSGTSVLELPANPPLGVVAGHRFEVSTVCLLPDDTLTLFTDGCIDAGWRDEAFGEERVVEVVSRMDAPPSELAEVVLSGACRHADGALGDDVAVVVLRYRGLES